MKRPAVFFDRDNTLIVNSGYLGDPAKVKLMAGAADAVARVRQLGFAVVVFSNQSGVARGLFDEDAVHEVNARMESLLAAENPGAVIDRHEFCPFHPEGSAEHYRQESPLRKPKPGMIYNAAEALALDLAQSWVIGDAPRDIEAGHAAGCRTILFEPPDIPVSDAAREVEKVAAEYVVSTLEEAINYIGKTRERGRAAEQIAATGQAAAPRGQELPSASPPRAPKPVDSSSQRASPIEKAVAVQAAAPPTAQSPPAAPEAAGAAHQSAAAPQPALVTAPVSAAAIPAREVRTVVPLVHRAAAQAPSASPQKASVAAPAEISPASQRNDVADSSRRLEFFADQILSEIRRHHDHEGTDFSVSKLLAGIVQMIALALLFAAYVRRDTVGVQPMLLLAIFAETLTIALLIMSRQK